MVKSAVVMVRSRPCPGLSSRMNGGLLPTLTALMPWLTKGKPGWWVAELNRESRRTNFTSACRVADQHCEPSHRAMRLTGRSRRAFSYAWGGANGQLASLGLG